MMGMLAKAQSFVKKYQLITCSFCEMSVLSGKPGATSYRAFGKGASQSPSARHLNGGQPVPVPKWKEITWDDKHLLGICRCH